MMAAIRAAIVALIAVAAAVLAAVTSMTSAIASTALFVPGLFSPTIPDLLMRNVLRGEFADDTRESVFWPAQSGPFFGVITMGQSVAIGVPFLHNAIDEAVESDDHVTVIGISAGSLVVDDVLRGFADDPSAPDPDKVSFLLIGDGSRQMLRMGQGGIYNGLLDYTVQPLPDTPYDVVIVNGEYDGYVDFPDRPWNLTAAANALAGGIFMHLNSAYADLSAVPPENVTRTVNSKGGVTTTYLVPAKNLPLVQLVPVLAPYEDELKEIVDAGYSRNDPTEAATTAAAEPTSTQPVVQRSAPTVASVLAPVTDVQDDVKPAAQPAVADLPAADTPDADADEDVAKPTLKGLTQRVVSDLTDLTEEIDLSIRKAPNGFGATAKPHPTLLADLAGGNKFSPLTASDRRARLAGDQAAAAVGAVTEPLRRLFSGQTTSTKTTEAPAGGTPAASTKKSPSSDADTAG